MTFKTDKEIEDEIVLEIETDIGICLDNNEPLEALIEYIRVLGNKLFEYEKQINNQNKKAYENAR